MEGNGALLQERKEMETIYIYTDGACSGNPGPGGWAAVLRQGSYEKAISGGFRRTTNNRMELMAVKEALEKLRKKGLKVIIRTDSQVVAKPFVNPDLERKVLCGKQANADIWKRIIELRKEQDITVEWVRGHAGDRWNEMCDRLAVAQRSRTDNPADTVYEMTESACGQKETMLGLDF